MTENPWPQASDPYTADPYGTAGTAPPSTEQGGASSKKDAVKEEASNVAGQAAGAAQGVAETAKAEAANVASEAKTSAKDLLHQAKSGLSDQAGTQQQKAAEGIRTISSQLRTMADAPEQQGVASDLIRQAADRSESMATWLQNRDPGSLLDEVKSFARQRPGTFLLLAAGAGLLAGRLGRSLQAGTPAPEAAAGTAPPYPVRPPVTDSSLASAPGAPLYDAPPATPMTYAGTAYGEPARPGFEGQGSAGVPLRDPNDPFVEGGGRSL
ncbi:hypothetical protein [Pseudarthrobacter sp. NS4]|uniref:hypothetical protein n=1 Tax=Pseudarthrobacter sp. NS4 TaxID=2973976 RepID=UPI0021625D77|nr:hypothetical protein [Pseudarthrobacter sp. NS4]